jgi:hypothetical protein
MGRWVRPAFGTAVCAATAGFVTLIAGGSSFRPVLPIVVVGPGAKSLGLAAITDVDPRKPYIMWAGTPYEHAMIPVGGAGRAAKEASVTKSEKK